MALHFQKITYNGWENCYRLANDQIELVITADVGPRLIRLAFIGQENEFAEVADHAGQVGGDTYRGYGGHRLWHAPEIRPRTYYPDNNPVQVAQVGGVIHLTAPLEPPNGVQKQYEITLDPAQNHLKVLHRITNYNPWAIELAPWALSVMAVGGVAYLPLPPRGKHPDDLLPSSTLSVWPYTDFSDPRWTWGRKYLRLRQDASFETPQKIGAFVTEGWAAYLRNGHLFLKTFPRPQAGQTYPDLGVNVEVFTNYRMLELETLGALVTLAPGAAVEHIENWYLFADVPTPQGEDEIDREILGRRP